MDEDNTMTQTDSPTAASGAIVARAGSYYRRARYIMAALLIAGGLWFGYDGFYGWPEENRRHLEIKEQLDAATVAGDEEQAARFASELKEFSFHTEWDLMLQKILFIILPIAGIGVLIWTRYNSRGEYRLENDVLHVPGHPPVPLDQITRIDKQLWDRKGIAFIEYATPTGSGRIRLDDFVYDAHPTRDIFKAAEERTLARVAQASSEPASTTQIPE